MAGNSNSGRPEFEPTDRQRTEVQVLKANGMTNVAIAEVIGIAEPTLRKHFSVELDKGSARTRAALIMARYDAATTRGNVSAQNRMLDVVAAQEAARNRAQVQKSVEAADPGAAPRKTQPEGKKAQRKAAANAAGKQTRLAPRPGPRLVVKNA